MVIIWTLSSSFFYLYGLMLVALNILTSSYQSWKFYILPPHNKERVLVLVVDSSLCLPGQLSHQPWLYLPCSAASNSRLRRHFAQPDFVQKLSKKPQFIKTIWSLFFYSPLSHQAEGQVCDQRYIGPPTCAGVMVLGKPCQTSNFSKIGGACFGWRVFLIPMTEDLCQHCDRYEQFV